MFLYPTGQGSHDVEPYDLEPENPLGHARQEADPVVFANVPGVQESHVDPAREFLYPTGQGSHDVEPYDLEPENPLGHARQEADPVVSVNVPGVQESHVDPAREFLYPTGQGSHDVEPYDDDVPISQGVHTLLLR